MAYCPVHEACGDHDPSLTVSAGSDRVLIHCFVCGEAKKPEIVYTMGLVMKDLYFGDPLRSNGKKSKKPSGKRIATFEYRNEVGAIAFRVERWEPKDFLQCQPNGSGGWTYNMRGVVKVPYKLPELIAADKNKTVFIVEGETKVESLMKWGLVATCNAGGAKKWTKSYSQYLAGRDVVILPDNDPTNLETGLRTGFEHAKMIIDSASDIAKSVRIIELPGLPLKGDIIDWIKDGHTLPELMDIISRPAISELEDDSPLPAVVSKSKSPEVQDMDELDLRIPESQSDIGNAKRFIRTHDGTLKFCYPWKKWLAWDGRRWSVDQNGSVFRTAKKVALDLWDTSRLIMRDVSEETLKKILTFVRSSGSDSSVSRMIHLAESEEGHQFLPMELDANPWLLNCLNGTVDLQNGVLKPHDKGDLITQICQVNFDPTAKCPVWEGFLLSAFENQEMVDYVQRLCGSWSTGIVKDEVFPVLWGSGSNGKTVFTDVLMTIFGPDYSMKAATDFLMVKKFQGHPTEKADLFRKRLVLASESDEHARLDESMVKDLTGREKIRARRMREDFWEFDPTHKIALMTNHLPQIRGTDHGIWRRIRKIQFGKSFWNPDIGETGPPELMRDNTLTDRILAESSGVLTWIVRGAIDWHLNGEQAPASVTSWTKEYRESQDVIGSFIDECCIKGDSLHIPVGDLYAEFSKWCKESNEYPVKKTKFGILMTERGYERCPRNRSYIGISLYVT